MDGNLLAWFSLENTVIRTTCCSVTCLATMIIERDGVATSKEGRIHCGLIQIIGRLQISCVQFRNVRAVKAVIHVDVVQRVADLVLRIEVGDTGYIESEDGERIRILNTVKENNLTILTDTQRITVFINHIYNSGLIPFFI